MDLVDEASKNDDVRYYRLSLLARTLKTDDKAMQMINKIAKVLSLRTTLPFELSDVLNEIADEYMVGLAASSSESGWFLNSITQTKIKYEVNNPEAKKMIHLNSQSGDD